MANPTIPVVAVIITAIMVKIIAFPIANIIIIIIIIIIRSSINF